MSGPAYATREDVVNGIKSYLVAGKILSDEKADAISMDCLGTLADKEISLPCISWSRMNDDGIPAACEADVGAIAAQIMVQYLFDRPGFQQDPAPLTVNNTLVGAHCTSPTKLRGFDKPPEPFILRSHSEADRGVAPQVLWPVGERMTIMDLYPPSLLRVGAGTVISNIEPSPKGHNPYEEAGGCRTSVEVSVDGLDDIRDVKGFHQLFILGDFEQEFKNYAQLANLKVEHI